MATQPDQTPTAFDYLNFLQNDQERAYYELGPVWGTAPLLHEARMDPGKATHIAIEALLDHIEARGVHTRQLRAILAGCQAGSDKAITPSAALFGLSGEVLDHVLKVLAWIAGTGGITLDDFADGGERYLRLVLRKRPKAIAWLKSDAHA